MDLMLVERGARFGTIPNSVDWNELIVNAMLDFSGGKEHIEDLYGREENVIKLCELKRAIESSPGYEEACATRIKFWGGIMRSRRGSGDPSSQKSAHLRGAFLT